MWARVSLLVAAVLTANILTTSVSFANDAAKKHSATPTKTVAPASTAYDPGSEQAKSGRVYVAGHWLTVEEAWRHYAESENVRQYRTLRDSTHWNVVEQIQLARWCREHSLDDSAQFHFKIALQLSPRNKEVRDALGLREVHGMLLTDQQLVEIKANQASRSEAQKHWKPRLTSIKRKLQSHRPVTQQAGLDDLQAIDDPSVLPCLELALCPADVEIALAATKLIATFDSPQGTEALIRQSVINPHPKVRSAIAGVLKTRSYYRFVPMLLSLMRSPVEVQAQMSQDINPSFALTIFRHGPFADTLVGVNQQTYTREQDVTSRVSIPVTSRDQMKADPVYLGQSGYQARPQSPALNQSRMAMAANLMAAAESYNQEASFVNERVAQTLAEVTDRPADTDSGIWYRWWYDYNEYPYPAEQPLLTDITRYTSQETATNTTTVGTTTMPVPTRHSCFCAGTPVLTWTGPQAIEQIRIGDMVLAQSAETGELTFKPVLARTQGAPSLMLTVKAGDVTLHLTKGHPLWVIGQGWRMAKEVKSGDQLLSLNGPIAVDSVDEWANATTHNLIVADFNDYFVSNKLILAHDITLRRPTDNVLPGVPPTRVAAK